MICGALLTLVQVSGSADGPAARTECCVEIAALAIRNLVGPQLDPPRCRNPG